jgi:hypothetical protein
MTKAVGVICNLVELVHNCIVREIWIYLAGRGDARRDLGRM